MVLFKQSGSVRGSTRWHRWVPQSVGAVVGAVAIATLTALPGLADPFRSENPHTIDDQTELAFAAMFRDGDYQTARQLLTSADGSEPLSHAMAAAFSYLDEDWGALQSQYEATLRAAEQIKATDPLRGHLYTAVGHFMEGGYIYSTERPITAIPKVLGKLSQVLSNIRAAEAIDATDPELNLVKGYMDLLIAVNLPNSDVEGAIARLEAYGSPTYLVQRGIAIAHRDLKQHGAALEAVNQAMALTAEVTDARNPDLLYLRGQILRNTAEDLDDPSQRETVLRDSVRSFNQAFRLRAQMPEQLAAELGYELCRAQDRLRDRRRNCRDWAANAMAAAPATNPDGDSIAN